MARLLSATDSSNRFHGEQEVGVIVPHISIPRIELEGKPKFLICLSPVPIIIDLDQSQGSVGFRRRFILFERHPCQFPGFGKGYVEAQLTKQTIEEVDARQARISRRIFRVQGDSAFELLLVASALPLR